MGKVGVGFQLAQELFCEAGASSSHKIEHESVVGHAQYLEDNTPSVYD
jgi:hypothetical protein